MNVTILLCGVCAFVLGLLVGWVLVRRARLQRNAPIAEWLDLYKATAGDRDKLLALPKIPALAGKWDRKQYEAAVTEALEAIEAAKASVEQEAQSAKLDMCREKCAKQLSDIRDRGIRFEDAAALMDIKGTLCGGGPSSNWISQQLKKLAEAHVDDLLEEALNGHRQAFLKLLVFVASEYSSKYRLMTGAAFKHPPYWDLLMVEAIEKPVLADFVVTPKELTPGKCSLMAADAVRDRNLLHGKLVMAFCNLDRFHHGSDYRKYREEIGDVLYAAVVDMVADMNRALNLSTAPTTTK